MVVGTHNGVFHADEVFATVILKKVNKSLSVVRTRDEVELKKCEIVYDVGGGKYDHHQREKRYRENGIPYASFGLIYEVYGKEYIKRVIRPKAKIPKEMIKEIYRELEERFVQSIDGPDNGVEIYKKQYSKMDITDISEIISTYNPQRVGKRDNVTVDKQFHKAVIFASWYLEKLVLQIYEGIKSKQVINILYQERKEEGYLEIPRGLIWGRVLSEIDKDKNIQYILMQAEEGEWDIQGVPKGEGYEVCKPLPKAWGGLREKELEEVTGIEGSIFCHNALFFAVFKTKEGAIAAIEKALKA